MSQDLNFNQAKNLPNAIYITSTPEEADGAIYSKVIQKVQNNHKILISSKEEIGSLCAQHKIVMPSEGFFAEHIYVRNPFNDNPATYIKSDSSAALSILQSKCPKILDIAEKLGATSGNSRLSGMTERRIERSISDDMSVHSVPINGKFEIDLNIRQTIKSSLSKHWIGKSKISDEEYAEACNIATTTGLIEDPEIASMLKSRAPGNTNPNTQFDYTIDLTREANKNIDAAFAIASAGYFDIDASYKETIKESVAVSVELSFSFPIN